MRLALSLCCLLGLAGGLGAQEYRATVLGSVTDPTGAAVPKASVVIANNESGVSWRTETNSEGAFQVPYLLPGVYTLEVAHPGFKTHRRGPIELRVDDRARIDVALEIGRTSEQVTVTAEAPLLEETTSSRGQIVTGEEITGLPLDGHNPFSLMNLAAGVNYTGSLLYSRPFDNGAIADFSINGGQTGINEYQIDGVSNNANTGRSNLAYVPPAEATQEFKVQTNIYDAQVGRTGGGVVNVSIKPGTNRYHGALYEYLRRTALDANQFASNAAGQPRTKRTIDQYGGEIDGPVNIPGLYRGKDRTFFMFSMERYNEATPQPSLGSVPTPEQRAGDFSQTFTASGRLYAIHDVLTQYTNPDFNPSRAYSMTNLRYMRLPFPGNQVPKDRMEPITLRVLKDIPLPNQPGHPVTKLNNWFGANVTEDTDFRNFIARVDHVLNQSWKMYGRWNHNLRDGGRIDYWGWGTPATRKIHAGRRNDGGVLDFVGTLTPRAVFTARIGFNRFKQSSQYQPIDIGSLGFPKAFVGQLQIPDAYPQFTFENYMQTGVNQWDIVPSETYSAQAGMNHILGRHTLKYGFEYRLMHQANFARANASGTFGFTRSFTTVTPDVSDANSGNAIASFLLGYMGSASAALNATPYVSWRYPVVYVQEDWRVLRRLTVNIGLRWDYESPPYERYDRQNRGFDFTSPNPIQVGGLQLRGGLLFSGVNGVPRGAYRRDWDNIQPRFGFAYKVFQSKPLVLRGGFGRSYLPTVETGGSTGFSQTTNAEVSSVEGRAIRLLSNPFPSGLTPPPGGSRGLATQAGDTISFNDPNRSVPYVWQYSAGFQYELFRGTLIEATYSGSQSRALQLGKNINVLSKEQLELGSYYLNTSFPNPFYNVLPPSTPRGTSATVQRRVLMLPYPQFSNINQNGMSQGSSWYDSLQLKLEKRFRRGFSALVSYSNSKTMERRAFLNAQDAELSRELVSYDIPQRLVLSGMWELPLGRRKKWVNGGFAARIAGGWQVTWIATWQSGPPVALPDYYLYGDPRLAGGERSLSRWFNTSPQLWVQRPPDTLRTTKLRSPNIRRDTAPQLNSSVLRTFRLSEKHKLLFKASAFNLSNTPIFGAPNTSPASPLFGVVPITQINLPRAVELGVKLSF
jgi:hypothetical protein